VAFNFLGFWLAHVWHSQKLAAFVLQINSAFGAYWLYVRFVWVMVESRAGVVDHPWTVFQITRQGRNRSRQVLSSIRRYIYSQL